MRATVVFVTALLVVGVVAPFAAAAPTADGSSPVTDGSAAVQDDDATNETDNGTAPGAQLAGVAEVQGAEVEGEVETRAFGLQVAAANSNASKASVVAHQAQTLDARLAELRDRRAELEAARENGSITESRYRAEIAGLAARIATLQRLSNATADTANDLPAEALAERGVNASAIERLRTSASNLSGPEVAAIARTIAGPPNGSTGPPANVGGPPGNAGPGENNTTAGGPGVGVGNGNDNGNGDDVAGDGVPGNGQNATSGQNNTAGGPGDDTPAENATDGNGPDAPGNGSDNPGNSGDVVGNETDTTDDDAVDATTGDDTVLRFGGTGHVSLFAGDWSLPAV